MNPDLMKALIEQAVKAGFDAASGSLVPVGWVLAVLGVLLPVIGTLSGAIVYMWRAGTAREKEIEAKLDDLNEKSKEREDRREVHCAEELREALKEQRDQYEGRIARHTAANKALRLQYESYRSETEAWLREQTGDLKNLNRQTTESLEINTAMLEQLSNREA